MTKSKDRDDLPPSGQLHRALLIELKGERAYEDEGTTTASTEFYHFRDNGLFLGQFGFQTSENDQKRPTAYGMQGFPSHTLDLPLAPGLCGDVSNPQFIQIGSDYYAYIGDEAYYKGAHRWHISNLSSIHELTASGLLGTTLHLSNSSAE